MMDSQSVIKRQSLITGSQRSSQRPITKTKIGLDTLLVFGAIAIILVLMVVAIITQNQGQTPVVPVKVEIPWPNDKALVMEVGTSRIFEPLLYSGSDNRAYNNFKQVEKRSTTWSVEPQGIISVDMYGRINAIKQGTCKLKLQSNSNTQAYDQRQIKVISKRTDIDQVPKRVIKLKGQPANTVSNLQKLVQRFTVQQVKKVIDIPENVKYAALHPTQNYNDTVLDGQLTWTKVKYANGQNKQYVVMVNNSKTENDRDKYHYFLGDRYLPDQGFSVVMIQSDKKGGVWIVGASGNTNHIKMAEMSYSQKAELLNLQTEKYVLRHGLASGAQWNGQRWEQQVSDNDGLWTSMYGAGQLMKYAVLKQRKADLTKINKARQSALRSLKAVLFTANAAGRQGKVQAKIRHLNNSRLKQGRGYSKQYLLQGKQNLRDTYVGIPSDGVAFYGNVADKNISNDYFTGRFKYSMLPINKEDWSENGTAATTEKSFQGFITRTFVIPNSGPPSVPTGGLFFQRYDNKTHKVLSDASLLYDYTNSDHPELQLGNKPIPEVLRSVLNINGVQYSQKDIVYKGDTSTDQVIGHLFIYKIAFDILDDTDNQQKQLKILIKQTMNNFCQHLVNNGYTMVDATGISTVWTKLMKQFLTSDYTLEDATLKAIQLLLSFKVAYYVTGEKKWKEEYDMLTKDQKYMYGKFIGMMWQRWVWTFTRSDDSQSGLFSLDYALNPSQIEIQRHILYQTHFSDEEEAYLAFYLAFQLQDDQQLLQHYRKGMNGYWHSISKSENPLWYYIYQLGYPETPLNDSYGQDLRSVAAWQLSRHMLDTTQYQANIKGARKDVIYEGPISVNPFKVIGKRTSQSDKKYVNQTQNWKVFNQFNPSNIYEVKVLPADERSIHKFNGATFENIYNSHNPRSIQPSTTYTLPYWLGVYHGLIKYD